jgi:hypothetical protein
MGIKERIEKIIKASALTLENMEPINCMVANVLGGSLASIPSKALDSEIVKRSTYASSPPPQSSCFPRVERDVRHRERPANATDITAVFNWWVAVI